jgi:transcriptional regulator with XRE-family HTH domain
MNIAIERYLATEIKVKRVMIGLSVETLAARLLVDFTQIEMWESGFIAVTAADLFRIAQALQIDVALFFPNEKSEVAA